MKASRRSAQLVGYVTPGCLSRLPVLSFGQQRLADRIGASRLPPYPGRGRRV